MPRELNCLRCETPMEYAHDQTLDGWSFDGNYSLLFRTYETIEAYKCPSCGKIELFETERSMNEEHTPPLEIDPELGVMQSRCPKCGQIHSITQAKCPFCGYRPGDELPEGGTPERERLDELGYGQVRCPECFKTHGEGRKRCPYCRHKY